MSGPRLVRFNRRRQSSAAHKLARIRAAHPELADWVEEVIDWVMDRTRPLRPSPQFPGSSGNISKPVITIDSGDDREGA